MPPSAAIIIGAGKPSAQELDIPSDAVAIDGTAPEKGDEIEFTIKAKVTGTEGTNLTVTPLECNGQKIEAGDEVSEDEPEEGSDDPDDTAMRKAEKADADEEAGFGHY